MRFQLLLLSIVLACISTCNRQVHGKTVFRRTDKISENFKQLDLTPEEVDPNVAPPAPVVVDTIDPEESSTGSGGSPTGAVEDVVEDVVEDAGAAAEIVGTGPAEAVDETVNEAANEVEDVVVAAANAVTVAPAAAPAAPAASAASAASAAAAAVATPKPLTTAAVSNVDDQSAISKYCKCTDSHCDCCRNFGLPIIPVRGPGCAKITYLGNQKMSVSLKYGDITLATRTISGKNAKPICVGLPGGYSKFCGRVYGLSKAKENFKACLGFELRAEDEIEAALRVSCFKFGPDGLRVAEAEPLPSEVIKEEDEDDDDIFGFAAGGDDEDEDDYDADEDDDTAADADADADDDEEDYADDEETEAPEDADYGGFSLGGLLAELADDDDETTAAAAASSSSNKPAAAVAAVVAPVTASGTRTAVVQVGQKDIAQSKNDKGTAAAAAALAQSTVSDAAEAVTSLEEAAVAAAVTPTPVVAAATTVKGKKSKKSKKNKKKKAATPESGYAYEIISGILDFFN